jgi:signal transduction histidine kinase
LRYLTKPWRNDEVVEVLRTSIELIHLQRTVREMEARLLQGGPPTTVTAFQQELAHEFNHPLASLVVNAELVSDLNTAALAALDSNNTAQVKALLTNAQEAHQDALASIAQLRSMVDRLRQGRKPSSEGALSKCEAARVIDSTVRIIRREIEKVARLKVVLEGSPLVAMDASALGQVILNILTNAAQAIGEGKSDCNLITVNVREEQNDAVITISDTGPGIAPDNIDRVFYPYFTTKGGNTGIGLSVVQELVKQAGGRVTVDSAVGKGATFSVILPLTGT